MVFKSLLKNRIKRKKSKKTSNNYDNTTKLMSEADFVRQKKKYGIGPKSALMEYAAIKRKLKIERLSRRIITIESKTGELFGFVHMNGNNSSRVGNMFCDRKHDARLLLQKQGVSVVESSVFKYDDFEKARKFAKKLGFPVVVKPTVLSRGRGITTNIQSDEELEKAWKKGFLAYRNRRKTRRLIIERHVNGDDYRFFVVGDEVISVTQRKRANVIGDGKSTILELIKAKNKKRSKNPYLSNYLIPEESNKLDLLTKEKISLNSIPKRGQEVTLRSQSNLSAGGDSIDFTDIVHPGFLDIAIKAVHAIPGIEYAGVDFIAQDITVKPSDSNYVVGEVEYSPAPLAHFPLKGQRRDMAGAILEFYLKKYNK